jgi:hypothetical protein
MYTLRLNTSFNTATTNVTSLFGTVPMFGPSEFQDGVMFANDNAFYLYGYECSPSCQKVSDCCSGIAPPTASLAEPPADIVYKYQRYPQGSPLDEWSPRFENISLGNITRYVTHGAGVSVPSEDLGLYVSGLRALDWGPIWNNETATNLSHQVITVDMSSVNESEWSNVTLPDHVPGRAGGGAVWVPISERGVLVLIGGVVQLESIYAAGLTEEQEAESIRASAAFMQTVSVYDIATDRWYVPDRRF